MRIDLHTHSTASDGTDTPVELVGRAATAGLDVVALTDHDTVAGVAAARAALPAGLTLVAGAELSCRLGGVSLHMLAYLFDPDDAALAYERELLRDGRIPRAQAMVSKLRALGVPVTWEQVARIAGLTSEPGPGQGAGGGGSVGRPHIAAALVEAGVVDTVSDAFTADWIGTGGRADVPKHELDPFAAISLVKAAGGVSVLAHPLAAVRGDCIPDSAIGELADAGLDGVEVDHMDHDPETRARLRGMAAELGLLTTGSSDYHGSRKSCRLGDSTTDPEIYGEIVRRATGAFPVPGTGG